MATVRRRAIVPGTAATHDNGGGVSWFSYVDDVAAGRRSWRGELRNVLNRFQDGARADDVLVVTSELVANSIEHGGGRAQVHVEGHGGAIRVEVSDANPGMSSGDPRPERGRGLRIVTALADEWGWSPTDSGKTIWAVFRPSAGRR